PHDRAADVHARAVDSRAALAAAAVITSMARHHPRRLPPHLSAESAEHGCAWRRAHHQRRSVPGSASASSCVDNFAAAFITGLLTSGTGAHRAPVALKSPYPSEPLPPVT